MVEFPTLLVLADPTESTLKMLAELPDDTTIVVGNRPDAFESRTAEADAILHWSAPRELLEHVFKRAPRLRWIHSRSAGVETVLFPALADSPVVLTNSRGVFSRSLSEFVLGATLFFAKDFRHMVRSQEAGAWDPFDVEEIHGKTMGIFGYGHIGRAVARNARALGMKVLALRRWPERSAADPLVDEVLPPERKPDLMARSDYLAVVAPLTPETRGAIGGRELRAMRRSAVIINIGRGPVVDEPALIRALRERWIRGAALDVFDCEPLSDGHPFYRLDNLLLSPHCADHTPDWLDQAMRCFLENFERFRKGEPLENVVDKRSGY